MYITNLITNKTFSRPISLSNHSNNIYNYSNSSTYIFLQTGHRQSYRQRKLSGVTAVDTPQCSVWCRSVRSVANENNRDLSGIYVPELLGRFSLSLTVNNLCVYTMAAERTVFQRIGRTLCMPNCPENPKTLNIFYVTIKDQQPMPAMLILTQTEFLVT